MSEEAKAPAETPAAAPPPKSGSKLVPMMMIMNTLLIGGVFAFVMKSKSSGSVTAPAAAAAGEGEKGEHGEKSGGEEHGDKSEKGEKGGGEHGAGGPGPMLKLENFVIQLKAVDSERYVRVAFDLEVNAATDEDVVKNRISQIRDSIISYFSDRTLDELRGSDGLDHVKQTLLKRLDTVVPGHRIKAVYITDFIIQ